MIVRRPLGFLLAAQLLLGTSAGAQAPAYNPAAWQEDLRVIARELPARHPNAFYRLTRARWDSAVAATGRRLPRLTRNQATVALMELVALVRDGHTSINPLFDPAVARRYYPLMLYDFEDGLYVRAAAPEYAALVGGKVLRIGKTDAAGYLAAARRVVPHENDGWLRAWGPDWLAFAEVMDGLGLVQDLEALPVEVEKDGKRQTVVVRPVSHPARGGHNPADAFDRSGWLDMRGGAAPPLWQRNPGMPYWVEYQAAERTLYVAYRAVVNLPAPNTNVAFWTRVFALADSLNPERLVLDLRDNSGGNSFYNRRVVRGIVARPALDRPDRLFVITGRRTFSAAMNLTRDLAQWTNATLVGEPTGNASFFFGDHVQVPLPASGITLNVSTLPWPPYDPRDRRDFVAPALYTPPNSADYRAGTDPALRAILALGTATSLADRLGPALHQGDTAAAERLVREAAGAEVNRFRSPEAEVNTLGYTLLNAGQQGPALQLIAINTRVFPHSVNAWDSLGEAMLAAGRRDDSDLSP